MGNRRTTILTVIAAALVSLFLPLMTASAQGRYDPSWGRNRDGRNDSYRRGYYNERTLRDAAQRVKNRSRNFQDNLDRALDRSRLDGTRREDRLNDVARDFHNAASRFEDRVDDGRNLNRSTNEARELIQMGARIDRVVSRARLDSRASSDWSQIRQDLRLIADIYGIRTGDFDSGYNRGRDDRRRGSRNFPF